MATSALRFGFELNIIGRKRATGWAEYGYTDKLWALSEFLTNVPNDSHTIILFVDAYDVIFAGAPSHLIDQLLSSGKRILFSSEKGCCPDWSKAVQYAMDRRPGVWATGCGDGWPPAPFGVTTPFLNSGAIIAFAPELTQLLRHARSEYEASLRAARAARGGSAEPLRVGDQELLCHVYSNVSAGAPAGNGGGREPPPLRDALGMGIDYRSAAFLSMHGVDPARDRAPGRRRAGGRRGREMPVAEACSPHVTPRPPPLRFGYARVTRICARARRYARVTRRCARCNARRILVKRGNIR